MDATNALKILLDKVVPKVILNGQTWSTENIDGSPILLYNGRNYVPTNSNLRQRLLQQYHDHVTAGHPGELETYNSLARYYWWPGIWQYVHNYVRGCGICQQFKINRHPSKPSFHPIDRPTDSRPFAQVSMDLITDLPVSLGFDSLLVMVDHGLMKGVILCPTKKTVTVDGIATLL